MADSNSTGAPAPTQLSKLTDSELEQEFVQLLGQLDDEQRGAPLAGVATLLETTT